MASCRASNPVSAPLSGAAVFYARSFRTTTLFSGSQPTLRIIAKSEINLKRFFPLGPSAGYRYRPEKWQAVSRDIMLQCPSRGYGHFFFVTGDGHMEIDIRDRATLNHADVTALNFIRATPPYIFRRHYRHGLRSHIMEILNPGDVAIEQSGTIMDGIRHFPMARPRRMFRIFRTRLKTLDEALGEIDRVKIVERFLGPDFMATSTECIVDYQGRPEEKSSCAVSKAMSRGRYSIHGPCWIRRNCSAPSSMPLARPPGQPRLQRRPGSQRFNSKAPSSSNGSNAWSKKPGTSLTWPGSAT